MTIVSAVWAVSNDRANIANELREAKAQNADQESRLRALERLAGETAADVRWIRQTMEKKTP